jgi:hypothetical protein
MASLSTGSDGDLEAQRVLLQPRRASYHLPRHYRVSQKVLTSLGKEVGGGEIHEMAIRPSEMSSASRASALLTQPVVSQAIGAALFPLRPSATYHADTIMNTRQGR